MQFSKIINAQLYSRRRYTAEEGRASDNSFLVNYRRVTDHEISDPLCPVVGDNLPVGAADRGLSADAARKEIQRFRRVGSSAGPDRLRPRNFVARARRRG